MFYRILHLGQIAYKYNLFFIAKFCTKLLRRLYACDIPCEANVEKSVVFCHAGLGIVINGRVSIGENTIIQQHVTIGKSEPNGGVPKLKNNCYIGTGAIILGDIIIGEYAKVGAGAVVLKDVPPYATVVGVPAKVVKLDNIDNQVENKS